MMNQAVPLVMSLILSYCAIRRVVSSPFIVSTPSPAIMMFAVLPCLKTTSWNPSPAVAAAGSVIVTVAAAVSSSTRMTASVASAV
jgi:hypothetical protein